MNKLSRLEKENLGSFKFGCGFVPSDAKVLGRCCLGANHNQLGAKEEMHENSTGDLIRTVFEEVKDDAVHVSNISRRNPAAKNDDNIFNMCFVIRFRHEENLNTWSWENSTAAESTSKDSDE